MKNQQQQIPLEENMSNLSSGCTENGVHPQPPKRKRSQPGHPDPDSEVIALSPTTLLATNRFVCEICNKGFQRDQNLQLHRRGHNLPWKLKQRTNKQVRKKVYVCPETNCVHHHPSRALGDLTGIKKHFYRKHGEKKWKCDKCCKKYAVQSDWKAHNKTCGTREYRCDCGTLFSRRDSFITHRAFCEALAQESARSVTRNHIQLQPSSSSSNLQQIQTHFSNQTQPPFSIKKEHQSFIYGGDIPLPPWMFIPGQMSTDLSQPQSSIFQDFHQTQDLLLFEQALDQIHNSNPNPNPSCAVLPQNHTGTKQATSSPQNSATALLQKAAQIGVKSVSQSDFPLPVCKLSSTHQTHVSAGESGPGGATDFVRNLMSSHGEFISSLSSYGNKAVFLSAGPPSELQGSSRTNHSSFIHDFIIDDIGFAQLLNQPNNHKDLNFVEGNGSKNDDGMTRDFLGNSKLQWLQQLQHPSE